MRAVQLYGMRALLVLYLVSPDSAFHMERAAALGIYFSPLPGAGRPIDTSANERRCRWAGL